MGSEPVQERLLDYCRRKVVSAENEAQIKEVVADHFDTEASELTNATHFVNDLGADSLDLVELVMKFEDELDINIPEEDQEALQTVGAAIEYIGNMDKE